MNHSADPDANWHFVGPRTVLEEKGKIKRRLEGRQIVVFATEQGLRACDNQCPHEGYPLIEGSVSQDCILTCNWHNWKFGISSRHLEILISRSEWNYGNWSRSIVSFVTCVQNFRLFG